MWLVLSWSLRPLDPLPTESELMKIWQMLLLVALTAVILVTLWCTVVVAAADAAPTGPGKSWALKWERQSARNYKHSLKHARCLGKRRWLASVPRSRYDTWYAYGVKMKRRAYTNAAYNRWTWKRIKNPSGTHVARWLPLCWHENWPRSQKYMIVRVIRRECGGRAWLIGAGGYYGLFQISQAHNRGGWNLLNPVTNVRIARQLYGRRGWQPWPTAY